MRRLFFVCLALSLLLTACGSTKHNALTNPASSTTTIAASPDVIEARSILVTATDVPKSYRPVKPDPVAQTQITDALNQCQGEATSESLQTTDVFSQDFESINPSGDIFSEVAVLKTSAAALVDMQGAANAKNFPCFERVETQQGGYDNVDYSLIDNVAVNSNESAVRTVESTGSGSTLAADYEDTLTAVNGRFETHITVSGRFAPDAAEEKALLAAIYSRLMLAK